MSRIDAVIFDWAGTTVDYGSFAPVQAFMEVFREYGVEPTVEEVRKPMGMLKIDHIRTMLEMPRLHRCWQDVHGTAPVEKDVTALYGLFEDKLMQILDRFAAPKPDTLKAVEALRAQGIAIGSTTGYTDEMMAIVAPAAKAAGYAPDVWFSPDSTGKKGRPYPYMIFRNMEALGLTDVRRVLKIGDTLSDIREGKNAGVITAGVVVGSSQLGLSQAEFEALPAKEQDALCKEAADRFYEAGADAVFMTLDEITDFIA
ncbi:MAG: phosphonoacetaldehyde hydrolase [Lentihominibacter sp.]